jgi:hypothetical protein
MKGEKPRTTCYRAALRTAGRNGKPFEHNLRRRHETNDIGNATNGSSGQAEKTKKAKLETTRADDTAVQRKEGNGSGNGGAGGSTNDSSNGGDSSAGRDNGYVRP